MKRIIFTMMLVMSYSLCAMDELLQAVASEDPDDFVWTPISVGQEGQQKVDKPHCERRPEHPDEQKRQPAAKRRLIAQINLPLGEESDFYIKIAKMIRKEGKKVNPAEILETIEFLKTLKKCNVDQRLEQREARLREEVSSWEKLQKMHDLLFSYVIAGNEAGAFRLKKCLNCLNKDGFGLLHSLCETEGPYKERRCVLKEFLKLGANINIVSSPYGTTPLFYAAEKDDLPFARLLLISGAEPNGTFTYNPQTKVFSIMIEGHPYRALQENIQAVLPLKVVRSPEMRKTLLQFGANPDYLL